MRERLVCANWKMHKTLDEARAFIAPFVAAVDGLPLAGGGLQVALFPAFPFIVPLAEALSGKPIALGGQCCHHEPDGAYTGAVSCEMLASAGARFVLVGHSERRSIFGEQDAELNLQLRAALQASLRPVLCVGESLEERERERTFAVISRQLSIGLDGLNTREVSGLAIAYEPVWAIGTGRTATAAQAQEVHRFIRRTLAERFDDAVAGATPLLYGGSVKPGNAAELMAEPDVDGVLVGGASLDPEGFAAITRAASESRGAGQP